MVGDCSAEASSSAITMPFSTSVYGVVELQLDESHLHVRTCLMQSSHQNATNHARADARGPEAIRDQASMHHSIFNGT